MLTLDNFNINSIKKEIEDWSHIEKVELAIFCAELSIDKFSEKHPTDNRPNLAIKAAKDWCNSPTDENKEKCEHAAYASAAAADAAYAAAADADAASAAYAYAADAASAAYASAAAADAVAYAASADADAAYAAYAADAAYAAVAYAAHAAAYAAHAAADAAHAAADAADAAADAASADSDAAYAAYDAADAAYAGKKKVIDYISNRHKGQSTQYEIFYHTSVTQKLAEGWTLYGSPLVKDGCICQAMIKQ